MVFSYSGIWLRSVAVNLHRIHLIIRNLSAELEKVRQNAFSNDPPLEVAIGVDIRCNTLSQLLCQSHSQALSRCGVSTDPPGPGGQHELLMDRAHVSFNFLPTTSCLSLFRSVISIVRKYRKWMRHGR